MHTIPIKPIRLRERTSLCVTYGYTDRRTYVRTDGRTGVTLNIPAIVMAGALNVSISLKTNFVLANSIGPDEMQHYDILSGSSPFAKVIVYGVSGIQRVKGR